ncbi:MAG TPA: hypothetical protein DCG58_09600 [Hyphomonas adhaerens]|uniref:Iron dicitrate transport regulator FecR n=1 Tax=Hyphomonas adhaerens TaxID=81029 RepID=A0A3B9GY83_9PROT|nr:hypothetical protein [Hyphomonas sp.]HAE27402.1 hypothetical protein [Hyphomonas adhaerens]|tara:strand:- start:5122 stop:6177 length:1056 start_codon:yes stop_codon:yes gene_type:complete
MSDRAVLTRIEEEAAAWHARLNTGMLSGQEARAFNEWLADDPEHERIFRKGQEAMRNVSLMQGEADLADLMRPTPYQRISNSLYAARLWLARRVRSGRIYPFAAVAAACFALAFALLGTKTTVKPEAPVTVAAEQPLFETATAEIRTIALPDGSTVTLGASSGLDVRFSDHERRVVLSEGEAFFEVEKDPARPFIVAAGGTLVRVRGTKFDVNLGAGQVDVAVLEGRVEVIRPENRNADIRDIDIKHVLTAGQKVATPASGQIEPVKTVEAGSVAAWRRGELIWSDEPVRDIIVDLNRYSENPIVLADASLGDLEYTLVIQADEVRAGVQLLAASLGLQINEAPDGGLILE